MKTNTKLRKRTHKFIDDSRVYRVIVMPQIGTMGYGERGKNGLPALFAVDINSNHRNYTKSLLEARMAANHRQSESPRESTYILEKVRKSYKRINLN